MPSYRFVLQVPDAAFLAEHLITGSAGKADAALGSVLAEVAVLVFPVSGCHLFVATNLIQRWVIAADMMLIILKLQKPVR